MSAAEGSELTGAQRDMMVAAGLMPPPAPDPVTGYVPPTALADRIRDTMRAQHARCDRASCPLSFITAEDVQEILDARAEQTDQLRARLDAVTAYVYLMERHGLADPHVTGHLRHLLGGET